MEEYEQTEDDCVIRNRRDGTYDIVAYCTCAASADAAFRLLSGACMRGRVPSRAHESKGWEPWGEST